MSKGFVTLGINTEKDMIRYSYCLALSIKASDPTAETCLIVDHGKSDLVPSKYFHAFDYISELYSYGAGASANLSDLDSGIYSDIEDFANDKILGDIEDWWNNDGGYGVLSILVPSGKYRIDNSVYITNTEHYTHAGNLINQTLD